MSVIQNKKKPLVVLTGPTAVGKTKLSIALAKVQAVLALGHPQLERQRLCIQFIAFRSHWHH